MTRYQITFFAGLFAALTAALLLEGPAGAAKSKQPQVVASPASVMVNRPVKLKGAGFAPNATLDIEECGQTSWSLPLHPCSTGNALTVTTNAKGKFKAAMTAKLCPQVAPPTMTEETCYVGAPSPSGIDTIALTGAAQITVSWP